MFLNIINLLFLFHTVKISYCEYINVPLNCKLPKCSDGETNSICRNSCQINRKCQRLTYHLFKNHEKQMVLDFHNHIRNRIASGSEEKLDTAANMAVLNYDDGLEATAHCWIIRCKWNFDPCRRTARFGAVGQSLFKIVSTSRLIIDELEYIEEAFNEWYGDIQRIDRDIIDNYREDNTTRRLTQMIWATTTHVGCARASYVDEANEDTWILICNYGPSGNVPGEPVYRVGPSASMCSMASGRSGNYDALCGNVTMLSEDRRLVTLRNTGHKHLVNGIAFIAIVLLIFG